MRWQSLSLQIDARCRLNLRLRASTYQRKHHWGFARSRHRTWQRETKCEQESGSHRMPLPGFGLDAVGLR